MKKYLLLTAYCFSFAIVSAQGIEAPEVIRVNPSSQVLSEGVFFSTDSIITQLSRYSVLTLSLNFLNDSLLPSLTTYPNPSFPMGLTGATQLPEGGYFATAPIEMDSLRNRSFGVVRLNKWGVVMAEGLSPVIGRSEFPQGIDSHPEGGVVVCGTGSHPTLINSRFISFQRFDNECNFVWQKIYPLSYTSWASDVIVDSDGMSYATGFAARNNSTGGAFLMKLDGQGDSLYTKWFGTPDAFGDKIFFAGNDAVLVAGEETATLGSGVLNGLMLRKIDKEGNLLWAKSYTPTEKYSEFVSFVRYVHCDQTPDGGVVFTADVSLRAGGPFPEGTHAYLLKVNAQGEVQWDKIFLSSSGNSTAARVLAIKKGGYALFGNTGVYQNFSALLASDGTWTRLEAEERLQGVTVAPNPATSEVYVRWTQVEAGEARLILFDLSGRLIWNQAQQVLSGEAELQFSVAGLPGGVYQLELQSGDKRSTHKLIKQD